MKFLHFCALSDAASSIGVALTSQVIGASRGDGERRAGPHGGGLVAIDGQHGKILLCHQAYGVPLSVTEVVAWQSGEGRGGMSVIICA